MQYCKMRKLRGVAPSELTRHLEPTDVHKKIRFASALLPLFFIRLLAPWNTVVVYRSRKSSS